jgi:carbamoyltransferase
MFWPPPVVGALLLMSEVDRHLIRTIAASAAGQRLTAERGPADRPSFRTCDSGPTLRLTGPALQAAPRRVLGVSAFFHDAAAALIVDGEIVAAAHEEWFSRRKHDPRLPLSAVHYCLAQSGLRIADIDLVAFYEEPILQAERVIATLAANPPSEDPARKLRRARALLHRPRSLTRALGFDGPCALVQHHVAHAASAFGVSGWERAAFLIVDGVGEWATTTLGIADASGLRPIEQIDYPHSLGLFYAAITAHLGFRANEDEYKVMGLAPYGRPTHVEALRRVLRLHDDGGFSLDLDHMPAPLDAPDPEDPRLERLLGIERRRAGEPVATQHKDLARSAQQLLEEALIGLTRRLAKRTGERRMALAGGVALNGVATYKAFCASGFEEVFVQPAAGDAGGALGAALHAWHELAAPHVIEPRHRGGHAPFDPLLGPSFGAAEIGDFLRRKNVPHEVLDPDVLVSRTAAALAEGRLVGWMQGRMELGPRALGARSILADPRKASVRDTLNLRVKKREDFRPFAPIVTEERARDYFSFPEGPTPSPLWYMLFVVPVVEAQRANIPAVVHADGTARPQLVARERSPRLHALLRAFEHATGVPVLLNTSFNVAGEPIVCSPEDAYRTFCYAGLDMLVMENHLVERVP